MIDFEIQFIDSKTFNFIDNSDYTGVNVVDTNLSLYIPPISSSSLSKTIPLYSTTEAGLPVQNLGDNAQISTLAASPSFSLPDGTHRFLYNITLDNFSTITAEKIFIKEFELQNCKKSMVQKLISSEDEEYCKACEATSFDAILNAAKYQASISNYIQATEMTEYLKNICTDCNC